MKTLKALFIASLRPALSTLTALAASIPAVIFAGEAGSSTPCQDGLCTIMREIKSDDGQTQHLPYTFKYRAPKNGAPTVVYIPGGPGQTSTDLDPKIAAGIPDDFGLIFTDPMFVGANKHPDARKFKNSVSSAQVAKDIQAAIEETQTRSPIIVGVSYGTIPATILASKLSESGSGAMKAVVLDGTVGSARSQSDYTGGYIDQWSRWLTEIPETDRLAILDVSKKLVRENKISPEDLGNIYQNLLIKRNMIMGSKTYSMLNALAALASKDPKNGEQTLLKLHQQIQQGLHASLNEEGAAFFRTQINCRELILDGNPTTADLIFDTGLKPAPGSGECRRNVSAEQARPYNSKEYQVAAPIVYLQGELDPATPTNGAIYHAQNQLKASKQFVVVPNSGHGLISSELHDCSTQMWNALAAHPETAARALAPCVAKISPNMNDSATSHKGPRNVGSPQTQSSAMSQ